MVLKQFLDDERGVSVVLGALLILGIIVAVFPIFYRGYVEGTIEDQEINHMEKVESQFREMQEEISWMGKGSSGTINIQLGTSSIAFSTVKSPKGRLITEPAESSGYKVYENGSGGGASIGGGEGGTSFDVGSTVAFQDGEIVTTDKSGKTTYWGVEARYIGPLADIDGDGLIEIPYISNTGQKELKIIDINGEKEVLTGSASQGPKSRLAVGTWGEGENIYVFYVGTSSNQNKVYKVDKYGNESEVFDASDVNGAQAVGGVADIDGDGNNEIVFWGSSQKIHVYDNDDGNTDAACITNTGETAASNNGVGIGEPADFDGDGTLSVPYVNGSDEIWLLDLEHPYNSNSPTLVTTTEFREPITPVQWDDDTNLEIAGKAEESGLAQNSGRPHTLDINGTLLENIHENQIDGSVGTASVSEHTDEGTGGGAGVEIVENLGILLNPGNLEFIGSNIFFVDQNFVYEGGLVFLVQDKEQLLKSKDPMFSLGAGKVRIEYPRIVGEVGSPSSSGEESITLEYTQKNTSAWETKNFEISIETKYEKAWKTYLEVEEKRIEEKFGDSTADVKVHEDNVSLNIVTENSIVYSLTERVIEVR